MPLSPRAMTSPPFPSSLHYASLWAPAVLDPAASLLPLQARGSIPVLWSQPPDVLPRPAVRVVPDRQAQLAAFGLFANALLQRHQVRIRAVCGGVAATHSPGGRKQRLTRLQRVFP